MGYLYLFTFTIGVIARHTRADTISGMYLASANYENNYVLIAKLLA